MEQPAAGPSPLIDAGDGITLHPAVSGDAVELYALVDLNRARLQPWLPWATPAYSIEDTRRFLEQCEQEHDARQALALLIRDAGVMCGTIGMHRIDPRTRSASLGYWLDHAHEGRGIVTRACRALITEAFTNYGLHRIEIRCSTRNERSAAIPRRLGFIEEGILREAEWVDGHWHDLRVFSLLRPDERTHPK